MLFLKQKGLGKPNSEFHWILSGANLGEADHGVLGDQTSWVVTSWRHEQTSKEKLSPTRTQFLSSQPPFLPALEALLQHNLQALAGQETSPVSCPLPVIQVLFASMNYQPIPLQHKNCSKKAFIRSYYYQRDLPAIYVFH